MQVYDKYIKMAFEGIADVFYPEENCRFTTYIIRNLYEWKKQLGCEDVDLVHWNAGLWDDLVMIDGKPLVSLEDYKLNIERICNLISQLFPTAKMIFATSTPVREELFNEIKRFNKDTEAYNKAATETVTCHGGSVNDLYTLMTSVPVEYHSDLTHYYTKEGTRVITEQVKKHIENALGIKGHALDYDRLFAGESDPVGM